MLPDEIMAKMRMDLWQEMVAERLEDAELQVVLGEAGVAFVRLMAIANFCCDGDVVRNWRLVSASLLNDVKLFTEEYAAAGKTAH